VITTKEYVIQAFCNGLQVWMGGDCWTFKRFRHIMARTSYISMTWWWCWL